jgi:hypothetical protein
MLCQYCGVDFNKPQNKQFCSLACANKAQNTRGERAEHPEGYILVHVPDHPRALSGGYVLEHILIVEKAMGRFLPPKAEVHHWNENKTDNRNENLVVCQDRAYHFLLHARMRIKAAGGDPNTDKICSHCRQVKNKSGFRPKGNDCRPCHAADVLKRKHAYNN